MAFPNFQSARLTLLAVFFFAIFHDAVAQFEQPYCSTANTAATARNESIYQSNSLCYEWCNGQKDGQPVKYALAIVQYQACWCTNFAPASTTTGCDKPCPGWAPELCGNTSPSLYGYIKLPAAISGTQGGSAPTQGELAPSSTSAAQATVSMTSNIVPTPSTTSSTSSSSDPGPTTTSRRTTSSSSTSSTWTPTPITSLQTVTGQVRTVTVTPTVPPNVQATGNPLPQEGKGGGGKGLGTGGAVGLTIGLVALVAIIGAGVFFFFRKRRRDQQPTTDDLSRRGSSAGFGAAAVPSRTMSENSRYVLGTDGRRVVETWEPGETAEVRKSRLIPVDQRLDPFSPVYQRGDNKSRESVNTIRDDHDYSRRMVTGGTVLRATNPD